MSDTKNVKGNRQVVRAAYEGESYFKIPDGLDLEDSTIVEYWLVKWNVLSIKYVGKEQLDEIQAYDEWGLDLKNPYDEEIKSAGDADIDPYEDEDKEEVEVKPVKKKAKETKEKKAQRLPAGQDIKAFFDAREKAALEKKAAADLWAEGVLARLERKVEEDKLESDDEIEVEEIIIDGKLYYWNRENDKYYDTITWCEVDIVINQKEPAKEEDEEQEEICPVCGEEWTSATRCECPNEDEYRKVLMTSFQIQMTKLHENETEYDNIFPNKNWGIKEYEEFFTYVSSGYLVQSPDSGGFMVNEEWEGEPEWE